MNNNFPGMNFLDFPYLQTDLKYEILRFAHFKYCPLTGVLKKERHLGGVVL
jgi:hypothetical protein